MNNDPSDYRLKTQAAETAEQHYARGRNQLAASREDEVGRVAEFFRREYGSGHPDFLRLTLEEIELHSNKNHDYAKGGAPTGNFDRVAAILALYPGLTLSDRRVVALVYALKQFDAVLWGLCRNIAHKVEGINERLRDVSVYCKLVMCMTNDLRRTGPENSSPVVGGAGTAAQYDPTAKPYGGSGVDSVHGLGGVHE